MIPPRSLASFRSRRVSGGIVEYEVVWWAKAPQIMVKTWEPLANLDGSKRAVKTFTGKEEYAFGDVSREVMRRFEEPGGADAATAFGDSDGSTAIDVELAEELDRWDARFLAARDADTTA